MQMNKNKPSRHKLLLALTWTIPVVVLILVELGLRAAGVAEREPLFVPVSHAPGYLQPNERAIHRFFADPSQAPRVSIDTTYFQASKGPRTSRIVVQGGSSAAGFPYGKWAAVAALLEQRLQRTFPEREIEVVSTAMSAVNSYALVDFADEILAQEPDLIVIYAGHNEYLGVQGVGSAYLSGRSPALTRLSAKLRQLRIYRLMESAYAALMGSDDPKPTGTLMATIAAERRIPLGSPIFDAGVEQFSANITGLLRRYERAQVPVLIATLASNERDQQPFTSSLDETTDSEAWQTLFDHGAEALEEGRIDEAVETLRRLVELDDDSADAYYLLARALEAEGSTKEARQVYLSAKDRDQLRFRAPELFNTVIRESAAEHGAYVVDVQQALVDGSERGVIGYDLMLEHLHPNVRGYFLLADAFYDRMHELGMIGSWDVPIPDEVAWQEIPVTAVDRLAGEYRVARLKLDWPFEKSLQPFELPEPTDDIDRIAQQWFSKQLTWADAMNQALKIYQQRGDIRNAARVAVNMAEAFVQLESAQFAAGQLLMRDGRPDSAVHYLRRAARLDPNNINKLLSLSQAYYMSGDRAAAARTLEAAARMAPDDPRPAQYLSVVRGRSP